MTHRGFSRPLARPTTQTPAARGGSRSAYGERPDVLPGLGHPGCSWRRAYLVTDGQQLDTRKGATVHTSKCTRRAGLGLLATLGLVLVPPASFADDAIESETQSVSVGATFSGPTSDPNGCIYADVDLFASETSSEQAPEPPAETKEITVRTSVYDVCTGRQYVSWVTQSPQETFDIEAWNNDKTARLVGTIGVCAASCTLLDIDLTFNCIGPADRAKSKFEFPGFSAKTKQTFCEAVAEGTVFDTEQFELDYVTTPSVSAEIGTATATSESGS
jgi:hypothetical protein